MRTAPPLLFMLALLCACTTVDRVRIAAPEADARWAVLPIANHTETPQAGLRSEAVIESVLRTLNVRQLERYPATLNADALLDPAERKLAEQAMAWAKSRGVRYVVTGSVEEWRYKVGVDGEPAVGLALAVTDLQTGTVIYSASGGKSGWSRESLAAVAQKLVKDLLAELAPGR
ncbi:MAG TPA: penicillin-binding protein activator LpoB [Burkholderiales bacterium]|nr:penicillin-binding protein activator LpoB [Burkholderiales bacterium]